MARICYGLFESEDQARPALDELTRRCDEHPAFVVQVHRDRLNALDLPDCGTDLGRNNMIAAVAGGGIGLVGGGLAGATLDITGLGAVSGAGFGFISGVLIGILSGVMSGARSPKRPLSDLSAELGRGKIMLTVAVDNQGLVRLVEDALDEAGGRRIGNA